MATAADAKERARLARKTCPELRVLLRIQGLKISGLKTALLDRLLGFEEQEGFQIKVSQHVIDFGHGEVEKARLEEKRQRLLSRTNMELRAVLKTRRQAVSGNKDELINRLLGQEDNNKSIENSRIAKLLEREIFNQSDRRINGSPMEAEALYHSRGLYQQYSFEAFENLLDNLQAKDSKMRKKAAIDDASVVKQLEFIGGMEEITYWGYKSWRNHAGKPLLRQDIKDGLHKTMNPKELWRSRPEYKDLKHVFGKRIQQEIRAIKQMNFNTLKEQEEAFDSSSDHEWSDDETSSGNDEEEQR